MNSEPTPKTTKEIWIDVFKDLIGFDRGYYYTLRAVYSAPDEVFESYFNNRGKYVSPFTLVGISFSIYYLISGFLVDWDAVGTAIKHIMKLFIEWEIDLLSAKSAEVNSSIIGKVYDGMIVPMTDVIILGFSKYLIAIVFPIQIITFYATSLFTRKLGYSFFHHFVSFNYFFSFSLLAFNIIIMISLINVWLFIPCGLAYNYFFFGLWLRSYGENKASIKKALIKGYAITLLVIMVISVFISLTWGLLKEW